MSFLLLIKLADRREVPPTHPQAITYLLYPVAPVDIASLDHPVDPHRMGSG